MVRDWIKGAIKHHGALHAQLGVPQGKKIPRNKLMAALDGQDGPLAKKRAQLANTLMSFHK